MPTKWFEAKKAEVEGKYKEWIAKQPPAVEVALAGLAGAAQGGVIGGMLATFTNPAALGAAGAGAMAMPSMGGTPAAMARNFAVMTGVNTGLSKYLLQKRGVEDVKGTMMASFGSGAAFAIVSKLGLPPGTMAPAMPGMPPMPLIVTPMSLATDALTTGTLFALLQGGFYKLGNMMGGGAANKVPDTAYAKASAMLTTMGLTKYEGNFKKALLTDATLPLLTDSALAEARIPPGPRLLILDAAAHQRY